MASLAREPASRLMLLWNHARGDSPLVVSVPHAGRHVPDALALRMTEEARAVPDTDWHVDALFDFVPSTGATLIVATHSRYVVDLNRDPSGAVLYPGADNTELWPTRTFANLAIYLPGEAPTAVELDARRATFFDPYHALLSRELERIRARHGYAILLDGHSIASHVPRFFAGRLPDLNLGTADGQSCDEDLQRVATSMMSSTRGFSQVVNGRFKGGYITRRYGVPRERIHALQVETAQACYMDESRPTVFDPARAQGLARFFERLVVGLSEWRPRA